MAGIVVAGAGAVGLAVAAEGGMDGTAAEVAELGDCEHDLGFDELPMPMLSALYRWMVRESGNRWTSRAAPQLT